MRLKALLTSDVRLRRGTFYGTGRLPTRRQWAQAVVSNLLPHTVKVFRRQRWLTSIRPVKETVLSCQVFELLPRSVDRWLAYLVSKAPPPFQLTPHLALEDIGGSDDEQEQCQRTVLGEPTDWAAFNEQQQKGAKKLLSHPEKIEALHVAAPILDALAALFEQVLLAETQYTAAERMRGGLETGSVRAGGMDYYRRNLMFARNCHRLGHGPRFLGNVVGGTA